MASRNLRKTVPCTYLKFTGGFCSKRCYGGICWEHIDRVPNRPCLLCGHGTHSASGYCGAPGACVLAQRAAIARSNKAIKRAAKNAPPPVTAKELDAFVEELLEEFTAL